MHSGADIPAGGIVVAEPEGLRGAPPRLTPRELQIFRLAIQGFTRKEIAAHLGISVSATADHIYRALARMDRPSLVSAVWAARVQLEAAG